MSEMKGEQAVSALEIAARFSVALSLMIALVISSCNNKALRDHEQRIHELEMKR